MFPEFGKSIDDQRAVDFDNSFSEQNNLLRNGYKLPTTSVSAAFCRRDITKKFKFFDI